MTPPLRIRIEKPTPQAALKAKAWPIWEKDVSTFPWHYGAPETCLLLEGTARVKTQWEEVEFGAGDLVTFPAGLDCIWTIISPIRKHYRFG